ncbi:MAG: hypothetical protein ABI137_01770 [Antricoccus sp.]
MSASTRPRGTSRPARRLLIAALPIAVIVGLAGCSAGQLAETAQIRSAVDGTQGNVGDISVRDASFAPPLGSSYLAGSPLPLNFTVINSATGPDEISAVTVDGQPAKIRGALRKDASVSSGPTSTAAPTPPASSSAATSSSSSSSPSSAAGGPSLSASQSASATPAKPLAPSTIALPANTLVSVGENATIVLPMAAKQYYPSQLIPVTITFKNAGDLSLKIPIGVPLAQKATDSSSDFNFHTGGE